ncbi:hypothetical protein Tco_0911351 [Tanacetum coccineum]|uniref:Uncharacterized protein n=1 Tax=Tanacetum coccineum TaxID=301880 RepID=A0ABQ5CVI1_9ASTR
MDDTSANIVRDSPSPADAETCARSYKTSSGGDTKALDQNPGDNSRVSTLPEQAPHGILHLKINEAIRENVKEAVQIALQAPLRECFRDLSEEDMKEMLHQRMFKSGTYKSLPEHIALYEALEASMERTQRGQISSLKRTTSSSSVVSMEEVDTHDCFYMLLIANQSDPHRANQVEEYQYPDSVNISDSEDILCPSS